MQVQREAQHSSHGHSFDHFLKGVHSAANMHTTQANDSTGGSGWIGNYGASSGGGGGAEGGDGNGQGSPLKYEMNGGGGEMLPQMREGSRF